jgi:hypothetical protein
MYSVKKRRDPSGFPTLYVADHVPCDLRRKAVHLPFCLVNPILAKIAQAKIIGSLDHVGRLGLGDGYKSHVCGVAFDPAGGSGDASLDLVQVGL